MREESLKHGAFGWIDLATTNVAGATEFYTALFGWQTEVAHMQVGDYTLVKVGGEPVGGIMAMPPECGDLPPCWSIYVTVDDVDATAEQVEELGGKVLNPPEDIPEVGRFCVIQDPQGAVICAITYLDR